MPIMLIPKGYFDLVLIQKDLETGLTQNEIIVAVEFCKEKEVFPIEFQAQNAVAMGFIGARASESLNYDHQGLELYIQSILNDKEKENESEKYNYEGLNILLRY